MALPGLTVLHFSYGSMPMPMAVGDQLRPRRMKKVEHGGSGELRDEVRPRSTAPDRRAKPDDDGI